MNVLEIILKFFFYICQDMIWNLEMWISFNLLFSQIVCFENISTTYIGIINTIRDYTK